MEEVNKKRPAGPGSFKERVLSAVAAIKKGDTLTYKQVAELAGSPRASRAVGNVLRKNRAPEIPCHRVIRSDGSVGGYRDGTSLKKKLLKDERLRRAKQGDAKTDLTFFKP